MASAMVGSGGGLVGPNGGLVGPQEGETIISPFPTFFRLLVVLAVGISIVVGRL